MHHAIHEHDELAVSDTDCTDHCCMPGQSEGSAYIPSSITSIYLTL